MENLRRKDPGKGVLIHLNGDDKIPLSGGKGERCEIH